MRKNDLNVHAFQNKNLCGPKSDWWLFFWLWLWEDLSIGNILSEKKYRGMWLICEKIEALPAELNKRVEAFTSSYSVAGNFLRYVYSMPVTKNHQNIWLRCLVYEFSFADIFNNTNHGYRASILKNSYLRLLLFFMAVTAYLYYEVHCNDVQCICTTPP